MLERSGPPKRECVHSLSTEVPLFFFFFVDDVCEGGCLGNGLFSILVLFPYQTAWQC